uniref:Uncharacterized protein n=1 Tax=Fagus sylvatica TaxID=28930 RepID=A0A2N9FYK6_FAGSY
MPEQKSCAKVRGGGFFYRTTCTPRAGPSRAARDGPARVPRGVLIFHASPSSNPPRFSRAYPFLIRFSRAFWRSFGTQNGSCSISSESSQRLLSNGIKFAQIGVQTRELWLSEVGVPELFLYVFPEKIPVKRGLPTVNREFHVVAGVVIFPTHPGPHVNLQQFARTIYLAADVGFRRTWYRWKACATLSCKVSELRETELGAERYGPANRGRRSVFGLLEGICPVRIPARPGKSLMIREFHTVHECVFFPTCPGSRINLLRARKTLRASAATSGGKFRNFQHSLISLTCFRARGRHSSRCRISAILVSSESLCYLLSKGSFSDRDSSLAGRALDDPEVARCS